MAVLPALFHQRLEHRIGRVFVELDAHLGPQLIGKIIELPASRYGGNIVARHSPFCRSRQTSKRFNSLCERGFTQSDPQSVATAKGQSIRSDALYPALSGEWEVPRYP
jgi:hypothetical protein